MSNLIQNQNKSRKNGEKDGKLLDKLMINAGDGKTMENLRKRIYVRLVSNEKYYLKQALKPYYMSQCLTMIYSEYVKIKLH